MNNTTLMNESFYDPGDSMVRVTQDDSCIVAGYIQQNRSKNKSSKSDQRNTSIVSGHFHMTRRWSVPDEDESLEISKILESSDCITQDLRCFSNSEKSSSVLSSKQSCSSSEYGSSSTRYLGNSGTNDKVSGIRRRHDKEQGSSQYSSTDSMETVTEQPTISYLFQRLKQNFATMKYSSERVPLIRKTDVPSGSSSYKLAQKKQTGVVKQFARVVTPFPSAKGRSAIKENIPKPPATGARVSSSPAVDKSNVKPVATLRKVFMGLSKPTEVRKPLQQVQPVAPANQKSLVTGKVPPSMFRMKKTPLQPAYRNTLKVPNIQVIAPTPSPSKRPFKV